MKLAAEWNIANKKFDYHDANSLALMIESIITNLPHDRVISSYDEAYETIIKVLAQLTRMNNVTEK